MAIMDVRSRYPIALAWPRLAMIASRVNSIAIHHSVTPTPAASWTQSQEVAVLDSIHRHHVAKGFGGIGYHLCCFPSGRWYYVCSLGQWGANVGGRNSELFGVCIIGTYTEIMPIDAALRSGALSVDLIDRYLKRKVAPRPHGLPGGWSATTCPGVIRNKAATIRSYLPAPPPATDPFWAEVRPLQKAVTLYRDTPLRNLKTNATIKILPEGTKLAVAAIYKTTDYLSLYSYSRKIANGFAVSATIPPVSCASERIKIAALTGQLATITASRTAWVARAKNSEAIIEKVRVAIK